MIVEIAAGSARRADRADHLVADVDDDAAAEEQEMRQLRKKRRDRRRLRSLDQRGRVVLEGRRGVSFVIGAVERMRSRAIATQHRLPHAIGIDENCGLAIALPRTRSHGLAHGFERQRCRDAVSLQGLGMRRRRQRQHNAASEKRRKDCRGHAPPLYRMTNGFGTSSAVEIQTLFVWRYS